MVQWVKNLPAMQKTGETVSIPESGRSPGGGHGYTLQDSCLENPMDRGAWQGHKELNTTEATEPTCTHGMRTQ